MAVAVSVLAGCAQLAPEQDDGSRLLQAILPPESLGRQLALSQEVVGEFQDQTQSLRVEVEITPKRLAMVGLTHMGVPVFSLEQDADGIEVEALGAATLPFNPKHILSDFQIAFWPATVLEGKLQSLGLGFQEVATGDSRKVLGESGEVLVQVTYLDRASSTGDIIINHFDHPYRLYIKTIEASGSW